MSLAAKLTVKLFAGDVLVAESEDARLWQRILLAMQEGANAPELGPTTSVAAPSVMQTTVALGLDGAVPAMADDIGVPVPVLQGACSPSREAPYLHLDPRRWESFKRSVPPRGPGSVGSTAVAGTLLALWREKSSGGAPSIQECLAVLRTLNLRDNNAARSIKNAGWLHLRNGAVYINPAERTRALDVARTFCSR